MQIIVTRYPGRTVWAGRFGSSGHALAGQFQFVLEQYGTMLLGPLLLLLTFLLFYKGMIAIESVLCWRRAREECGERNVKTCGFNNAITGATFRVESGCTFECFEPQKTANGGEDLPHERLAEIARYFPGRSPEEVEERFGKLSAEDQRDILEALQTVKEILMRNSPSLPPEDVEKMVRALSAEEQRLMLEPMRTLQEKLFAE